MTRGPTVGVPPIVLRSEARKALSRRILAAWQRLLPLGLRRRSNEDWARRDPRVMAPGAAARRGAV
jgi:hypothetical protein